MKVLSYKELFILKIKFCLKIYYTDGEGEKQPNQTKQKNSKFHCGLRLTGVRLTHRLEGQLSRQSIYSPCPATLNKTSLLGGGHLPRGTS